MSSIGIAECGRAGIGRAAFWIPIVACVAMVTAHPIAAAEKKGATLAFAVRDWATSVYETKFADECPEGLAIENDEVWWRSLSREERAAKTRNGLLQALDRSGDSLYRGPNKESACRFPQLFDDPPHRIVEGNVSYGVDLDGRDDDRATPKSCAHKNFVSPDGRRGIDNQMYRLVGCTYGWRKNVGTVDANANEMRNTSGLGMILIAITGVDDRRNDDDVTVTFYRSVDQWVTDSRGIPLPFTTYDIDRVDGRPRYGDSLKGKIVNGVLQTASGDVRLPFYGNYNFMHPVIRDMSLRLEIEPGGAKATGMIAGYYSLEEFIEYIQGLGGITVVNGINCPSFIESASELADGYPDETGRCTMLSSAFDVVAYAAFIKPASDVVPSGQ